MITVVSFSAFNKAQREIFVKGETFEQIHEVLHSMCSSYHVIEILQGEMANVQLSELTKHNFNNKKLKPTQLERDILREALEDYKLKAKNFLQVVGIGETNCLQLADAFTQKIEIADQLQKNLGQEV
jgi:hypothetical protein